MNDTSKKVEAIYRERILALSPEERLMMTCRMFDEAKELVLAGIKAEYPGLNEQETRIKLFTRMYGCDFEPEQVKAISEKLGDVSTAHGENEGR
jgi:hypothetical protein